MKPFIKAQSIFAILLIFFNSLRCNGQGSPKSANFFKKNLNSSNDRYYFEDSVSISDGNGDRKMIKFSAIIPVEAWQNSLKQSGLVEKEFFDLVADNLSLEARDHLKNPLSFSPFHRQTILWSLDRFTCDYKLNASNGLGISSETSIKADYLPNNNALERPLPKRRVNN